MKTPIHIYHAAAGKPTLLLGLGNGFPAQMYNPLAAAFGTDWNIVCLPARPWWPESEPESNPDNFHHYELLAEDMIRGIEEHGLAPVYGAGHSMGGWSMVMAAVKRPELFTKLGLIDPVFIERRLLRMMRVARLFGVKGNQRMIDGALKRQRTWESLEAAYQHFRQKSLFKRCSDEVVRLYVEGVTRPTEQGVELCYSPEWEAKIFEMLPLNEWTYVPKLRTPTGIVAAADSDRAFPPPSQAMWRRLQPEYPIEVIPNSTHMLPVEHPEEVARRVQAFWNGLIMV
jgi:pimeloyl-ACP methyl ester carboxylesterase